MSENKSFKANLCFHEGKPFDPETPEGKKIWRAGAHEDVDVMVHAEYEEYEAASEHCDQSGGYWMIYSVTLASDDSEVEDIPYKVLKGYEEQAATAKPA